MTRYLEIKPESLSEVAIRLRDDYQAIFKKELEKTGKSIGSMTPDEKKAFFNKIDKMHNAKNEEMSKAEKQRFTKYGYADTAAAYKKPKTTLVAAPGGKENVIRIPIEKLADYKAKGYVEAEEFVPEQAKNPYAIGMAAAMKATGDTPPLKKSTIVKAHDIAKKVKEEELTAGQKKLPPALQKAIEKKQKNEDVSKKEIDKFHTSLDKLVHKSLGPSSDEKKKEVKKEEVESIEEEDYDHNKNMERAIKILNAPFYKNNKEAAKKAINNIAAGLQHHPYIKDLLKKEEIEITETEGGSGGGIDALRAIKGKRLRLQQELERLSKDDPSYKEKAANLKKQIETQKEIMARKQREVYGSYDPSREDALDLNEITLDLNEITDEEEKNYARQITSLSNDKVMARINKKGDAEIAAIQKKIDDIRAEREKKRAQKNEAVDPERITNLQQKIQKMSADMNKIDMSKPDSKTKQAIIKSDLQTAQLRLKDLIQKKTSELNKEVKETKMGYKSFKQSLKKEQEIKDPKKTMTGQPVTKIDVEPKLPTK